VCLGTTHMNKVVFSAGLLALGATTLSAYDPEMTRSRTGRPWTVSAVVRGFYDDNPTTTPDKFVVGFRPSGRPVIAQPEGSFGFEVSPSVHVNLPLEQTFVRAGYSYSLRYFENRERSTDQNHEFNLLLRHIFSPRHDIAVADSFSFSDEPTVTDRFGIVTAPSKGFATRTDSSVFRNRGSIDYNISLTQVLGLGLGYVNTWYDYHSANVPGSRSALLDRLEHLIRADVRYQVNPTLVALVGYTFGLNDYTGDQFIYTTPNFAATDPKFFNPKSDVRNSYTHYLYVGVDHDFNHKIRASLRVGGMFVDYYNAGDNSISPYADASLTYLYLPDSSLQLGLRHTRNATDIAAPERGGGRPTLDQETTAVYAQLIHRVTERFTASVLGQAQFSSFTGGGADDMGEAYYTLGVNLEYRINYHWSIETGYNYDLLDSEIDSKSGSPFDVRNFDRNRVYVGVRATY
jgi:hypothetical protein